jgi:hypothetical protein
VALASPAAALSVPEVTDTSPPFAITATVAYDSNVARSSAALAALRGLTREDEIYSPSVQINLAKEFGSATAGIKASVGYDFYQTNTILNRENLDVGAGITQTFSNCAATLSGSFLRQQSDLDQLTVVVTKNTETVASTSLGVTCERGSRVTFAVLVAPSWTQNSATLLKSSDNNLIPVTAEIGYDFGKFGKLAAFGEYANSEYPDRTVRLGGSVRTDGYDLFSGGIRWTRDLGSRLKATAQISEISLEPRLPGDLAFSGLGYLADLTYRFTSRLDVEISAAREASPVNRIDTTYSIDRTYRGSVGYRVGGKTRLSVEGQIAQHRYFGAQIVPGFDLTRQTISSIGAKITHDLRSNIAVTLAAAQERGTADIPDYEYNDARAELSLSLAF